MHSFASIEFANATAADAERHWLYGHPYRTEQADRAYVGIRRAERPRRRIFARRDRTAGALAAHRGLAA